jgi:hypothetical protein
MEAIMKARLTLLAILAGLTGTVIAAEELPAAPEVSIPFIGMGSINDWRADNRQGLWIQDLSRQWYYARTMGPCIGLDFAQTIGIDARPGGTLDRYGSILVPHEGRCHLASLVRSDPPPRKARPVQPKDKAWFPVRMD